MKKTGIAIVGLLALLVGACGGGDGDTVADGGEIEISMFEYQFEPAEIHLKAGTTVTFVLTNDGGTAHELMAGHDVHTEDGHPHGFESDFFDTVSNLSIDPPDALETSMEGMGDGSMDDMASDTTMGDMGSDSTMGDMASDSTMGDMGDDEHMEMGVMVGREPAETARITFTVTDDSVGEWDMGCFEEEGEHWGKGMKGKIIVEEA